MGGCNDWHSVLVQVTQADLEGVNVTLCDWRCLLRPVELALRSKPVPRFMLIKIADYCRAGIRTRVKQSGTRYDRYVRVVREIYLLPKVLKYLPR